MKQPYRGDGAIVLERSRGADFLTLTKPELTFLSVVTAVGGAFLAGALEHADAALTFLHVMLGTLLVGGGAGALNQYIERDYDRLMKRTDGRPLPSGRLSPGEVLVFGMVLALSGLAYLTLLTNPLTAVLGFVTLASYLFVYTPLKRVTWLSTLVGGIPGALPPVMGWTAVRGQFSIESLALFAILFFWQMPHFFSLAWMYRRDYERAGFHMLTVLDHDGKRTGTQVVLHSAGLILATWWLGEVANLGSLYLFGSTSLGFAFFLLGWSLRVSRTSASARRVFFASLAYLPALLAFVVIDRL
jgi:protoheme IX farnesyltransferase